MKTISIHQPNFIPYLGFFYKWMKCDTFVFLDDAQFIKEGNIHRNRIKTSQGPQWLTIPILQKGRLGQSILEAQVTDDKRWKKKLLRTVYSNYSKAKYIDKLFDEFKEIFEKDECNLSNINIPILYWVAKKLDISVPVVNSFDLNISSTGTGRLVDICKKLNGSEYISGTGGCNYQDEEAFKKAGIKLTITDFKHPTYQQLWSKEFVPNLSVLDLLFNYGPNSKDILNTRSN